jgi:hypothetical protein
MAKKNQPKKRQSKASKSSKKGAKSQSARVHRSEATATKGARRTPVKPEFELITASAADPLGACIWYDNTGQPRCTTTTQSLCKLKNRSTFFPNQTCSLSTNAAKSKETTAPAQSLEALPIATAVTADIGETTVEPKFELLAVSATDPLGACVWYDNTGQPHCTTTTQNLCKVKKGTFYPNQACPF